MSKLVVGALWLFIFLMIVIGNATHLDRSKLYESPTPVCYLHFCSIPTLLTKYCSTGVGLARIISSLGSGVNTSGSGLPSQSPSFPMCSFFSGAVAQLNVMRVHGGGSLSIDLAL